MNLLDDMITWHLAFKVQAQYEKRTDITEVERLARRRLIKEEAEELLEALLTEDHEATLKEIVDVVVTCIGTCATCGWDFNEAWRRVLESNWSKLDDSGEPIFNEHGKIMKGPNYRPPDLSDLV